MDSCVTSGIAGIAGGCIVRSRGDVSDLDRAEFLASFPPIQSAIKRSGDNSGMRVQFDIPESEMGEAIKLLQWGQMVLRVTVEPEKDDRTDGSRKIKF